MKDTLSALPEFQEMKEKFSLHINICQECTSLFERNKLVQVAGIEQDVVTGETAEGKATKALLSNIVPVLNDGSVSYCNIYSFSSNLMFLIGVPIKFVY